MKNIKLTLAYDGSGYHGWQIQPGRETIQGALTEVAERLAGCRTVVQGAGRTDAGVHALGQVANFRAMSRLGAAEFQRAFNALLAPAIRVVQAEEVEPRFHARWDALGKIYQYRIHRGRVLAPFDRFFALHYPFPLDEAAMIEAARLFEGEHDFTSFASSPGADAGGKGVNPVRVVFRSELLRRPSHCFEPPAGRRGAEAAPVAGIEPSTGGYDLVYVVHGRSFLRNMVRKMVGTLLEVGRGHLGASQVRELFEARDRSRSGSAVAPQGLCLVAVEYAEPWRIGTP